MCIISIQGPVFLSLDSRQTTIYFSIFWGAEKLSANRVKVNTVADNTLEVEPIELFEVHFPLHMDNGDVWPVGWDTARPGALKEYEKYRDWSLTQAIFLLRDENEESIRRCIPDDSWLPVSMDCDRQTMIWGRMLAKRTTCTEEAVQQFFDLDVLDREALFAFAAQYGLWVPFVPLFDRQEAPNNMVSLSQAWTQFKRSLTNSSDPSGHDRPSSRFALKWFGWLELMRVWQLAAKLVLTLEPRTGDREDDYTGVEGVLSRLRASSHAATDEFIDGHVRGLRKEHAAVYPCAAVVRRLESVYEERITDERMYPCVECEKPVKETAWMKEIARHIPEENPEDHAYCRVHRIAGREKADIRKVCRLYEGTNAHCKQSYRMLNLTGH